MNYCRPRNSSFVEPLVDAGTVVGVHCCKPILKLFNIYCYRCIHALITPEFQRKIAIAVVLGPFKPHSLFLTDQRIGYVIILRHFPSFLSLLINIPHSLIYRGRSIIPQSPIDHVCDTGHCYPVAIRKRLTPHYRFLLQHLQHLPRSCGMPFPLGWQRSQPYGCRSSVWKSTLQCTPPNS